MTVSERAIVRGGRTAPFWAVNPSVPYTLERSEDGVVKQYELHLPWPTNPLPANGSVGHWSKTRKAVAAAQQTARSLTAETLPRLDRIGVLLIWETVAIRKRDEDNLWKLEKALVDGLRDLRLPNGNLLHGIVADDDKRYVQRHTPEIHHAPRSAARPRAYFRLLIEPLDPLP